MRAVLIEKSMMFLKLSAAFDTSPFLCIFETNRMSQFIVGLNKYLESVDNGFKVGMRFKMKFEGEDTPERRY